MCDNRFNNGDSFRLPSTRVPKIRGIYVDMEKDPRLLGEIGSTEARLGDLKPVELDLIWRDAVANALYWARKE